MPRLPKKIKRAYKPERKPFARSIDNSWFYNSWKWRKFTKGFKQRFPLCKPCEDKGNITATTVVDHKEQYKPGAPGWDLNNLKDEHYTPSCETCHNSRSGRQAHGKG